MSRPSRASNSSHLGDQDGVPMVAGIGGEHTCGVREHQEQLGAEQDRHLGGQEVVVTEGDLIRRGRVVLVDDRHDSPLEQLAQRLARVQVVRPRAHVEEGEQDLRGGHSPRPQELVVDLVELALANRARRLQLVHRARPQGQPHHTHAPRDGAAGNDHERPAGGVEHGQLADDAPEHVRAHLAAIVGDDARSKLDDQTAHGTDSLGSAAGVAAAPAAGTAARHVGRPARGRRRRGGPARARSEHAAGWALSRPPGRPGF